MTSREPYVLGHPFSHLRSLPDGTLTRREVNILVDEIERLRAASSPPVGEGEIVLGPTRWKLEWCGDYTDGTERKQLLARLVKVEEP